MRTILILLLAGTLAHAQKVVNRGGGSGGGSGEANWNDSSEMAAGLSDETGTGAAVMGTSPTIATPNLTGKIDINNVSVDDDDCTGEQGKFWYDSTDSAFEVCNANSGTPATLSAGSTCSWEHINIQTGITGGGETRTGGGGFSSSSADIWDGGSTTNTGANWAGVNMTGTTGEIDYVGRLIYIDGRYSSSCGNIRARAAAVSAGSGGGATVVVDAAIGALDTPGTTSIGASTLGSAQSTSVTRATTSMDIAWDNIPSTEVTGGKWHEFILTRDADDASDNYETPIRVISIDIFIPVDNAGTP